MKLIYPILVAFLLVVCWSCRGSSTNEEVAGKAGVTTTATPLSQSSDGQISKERFATLLGLATKPQLIDVRTPKEFNGGSIKGALNMDFYNDDFSKQLKSLDHSRPVFIYCKSGGRSGKTYKMLKDMGVEKVYDLKGGYSGWK